MKDENNNSIDDNIELLGILAGAEHLGNQRRQQELLAGIHQQLRGQQRARNAEEYRKSLLPQCPHCGGRLDGKFRKCMHCSSDISWVEDIPCVPGDEEQASIKLAKMREDEARAAAEKQRQVEHVQDELRTAEAGVPSVCARCNRQRKRAADITDPLFRTVYLREIDVYRNTGMCSKCCDESEREKLRKTIFHIILVLVILASVMVVLISITSI